MTKIGPRKTKLIRQLDIADKRCLAFFHSNPKIHIEKLTMKELQSLIDALNTMYELSKKCSDWKGDEDESDSNDN